MRRSARITADAFGSATGGNIAIATDFLVAPAEENSDITANADNNFGGNIEIQARRLLGIRPNSQRTANSDITASSQLGLEATGNIEINALDIDPSQGIVAMKDGLTDESEQVAAACVGDVALATDNPVSNPVSSFVHNGRGGLPRAATQPLSSPELWLDTRSPGLSQSSTTTTASQTDHTGDRQPTTPQLSEAQGWLRNSTGTVQLLASSKTLTPGTSPHRCLKSAVEDA